MSNKDIEKRTPRRGRSYDVRARIPKMVGYAAAVVLGAGLIALGLLYFRSGRDAEFRMKNFPASLSEDVVGTVNGYERRESENGVMKYFIRADRATSFADGHQELENAYFEVYNEDATAHDKMSSQKAVYIPGENKNFTAFFAGEVMIATRDGLKVKTEQLSYTRATETAEAEELVQFERGNVSGTAVGAIIRVPDKRVELSSDVDVQTVSDAGENARLRASQAVYDHGNSRVDLTGSVNVLLASHARQSELSAARATAFLHNEGDRPGVARIEMFDAVKIADSRGGAAPTQIAANYALYEKDADRFVLRDSVSIDSTTGGKPVSVTAANAVYDRANGRVDLTGAAQVKQGDDLVKGESVVAELDAAQKVRQAKATGNASASSASSERAVSVSAPELSAQFSDAQVLTKAEASGATRTEFVPRDKTQYSVVTMNAASGVSVAFKGPSAVDQIVTKGRTDVRMSMESNAPDASNKTLSADSVTTAFDATGTNIARASAAGNARIGVDPLHRGEDLYASTVTAPRFDCEFYPSGSNLKTCTGKSGTKTVRTPTVPTATRGTQTINARDLTVDFAANGDQISRIDASGGAELDELDRHARSEQMVFTASDRTVRLRGGSPQVWDGRARAKAAEIDWNSGSQSSELRGSVSTTYYDPGKASGAVPFGGAGKPVYVTSNTARFDHARKTAVFTGNARGWQGNNYVRGETLTIDEPAGRFVAENNVQSLLYEARRTDRNVQSNQPIFVAARKLTYTRDNRLLVYENNVDIRQGKDRITGGIAKIFLGEGSQPERTEVAENVVIVQPDRRAAADRVSYDRNTDTVKLQGNASVDDAERGSSSGSEVTIDLGNKKVTGEGRSTTTPSGRIRSVYKIKKP